MVVKSIHVHDEYQILFVFTKKKDLTVLKRIAGYEQNIHTEIPHTQQR
jgi:hypothetical protein